MPDTLISISKKLKYRRISKIEQMPRRDQMDLLNHAFKNSIRRTYAIFFFDASLVQITPYGTVWNVAFSRNDKNHYLTIHPKLEEKWFRSLFICFEMILFKICHVYFEDMKSEYTFEKSKTSQRFKKILQILETEDCKTQIRRIFEDICYVRDAFSHTFIDLDEIKFRGVPLDACFGTTYTGGVHNEVDFTFVQCAERLIDPFIAMFTKRQIEQIDGEKFAAICNHFLSERTLGR